MQHKSCSGRTVPPAEIFGCLETDLNKVYSHLEALLNTPCPCDKGIGCPSVFMVHERIEV